MAAQCECCTVLQVDYATLKAGLLPGLHPVLQSKTRHSTLYAGASPSSPLPGHESPDLTLLHSVLAEVQAENEELLRLSKLRELQWELSLLQEQNAILKGRQEEPPLSS